MYSNQVGQYSQLSLDEGIAIDKKPKMQQQSLHKTNFYQATNYSPRVRLPLPHQHKWFFLPIQ
jgi:hypothetical protein